MPDLIPEEGPEAARPAIVRAVVEVLERRTDQQHVGEHRDPEPNQTVLREPPQALAVERRAAQAARDQKEQAEPEEPTDNDHNRERVDEPTRHIVVRLQIPGAVEATVNRATRGGSSAVPRRAVVAVFALVAQILADAVDLDGAADLLARDGIWIAAILFPAGFFLASAGQGRTEPNRLIVLVYAGAAALTAGVLALGIGLLAA